MGRTFLSLLCLAACSLLPSSSWAEPGQVPEIKPISATVPFEILRTKHLAVKVMVNGKGPYRVIYDTGAPITLLNNKVAKEAELVSQDTAKMPAFFGMRGQMLVKKLELGNLVAEDTPVIVMDHPLLKAFSQVLGPVDGIIGFPFFARYRTTIDYQLETITFVAVDYRPTNMMDAILLLMMDPKEKPAKKNFSSSAVWGFTVDKAKEDQEAGVDIKEVVPGSAAEAAGFQPGDRLLILDGTWTDSVVDCYRAASGVQVGRTVTARIKRKDQELEKKITPRAGL
jgi:hypothetical protein